MVLSIRDDREFENVHGTNFEKRIKLIAVTSTVLNVLRWQIFGTCSCYTFSTCPVTLVLLFTVVSRGKIEDL